MCLDITICTPTCYMLPSEYCVACTSEGLQSLQAPSILLGGEGIVRVEGLAKEHNMTTLARAQHQTDPSGVQSTNH